MTEQKDPNGIGAHDGGAKLDFGKNRVSLLFLQYFPNAIDAVTSVSEFGAKKYSPGGWRNVPDGYQRYTDAMGRHILADSKGQVFDDETDLPHDFQIAWNALARIEIALKDGKYTRKTSKKEFVEALLEPYIGKEIPNDRKPAKSVYIESQENPKVETTIQPPNQDGFDPNASAYYIDVNGVMWMPVKKKSDFGYDVKKVVARHERMLKPHNAQDQNSRERDALKVPVENPDWGKAEAKSNIVPATPSLSAYEENIKQVCPDCGDSLGYGVAGERVCEYCRSRK